MTKTKPIPLVLKQQDWPERDRVLWNDLFKEGDLFDDQGPGVNWAEGRRRLRSQAYGQWLSFLMRQHPETLQSDPVSRITKTLVQEYISECQLRLAPRSVSNLVLSLYTLASMFGPVEDWAWLSRASKKLSKKAYRSDLPPPLQVIASEVLDWSWKQMDSVVADTTLKSLRRAIRFRQALMIGVLISRPVRLRTFLAMTVDCHVVQKSDGFSLIYEAHDMKDKRQREYPLPDVLIPYLRLYLDQYRPVLLQGKDNTGLWINQYGDPISEEGYPGELYRITKKHLGKGFRTHAFRHMAATYIAEKIPEYVGITKDVLGHATLDMSERHYNRATAISSCNALQSIVEDIAKSVPIMGRAKRSLTPPNDVGKT